MKNRWKVWMLIAGCASSLAMLLFAIILISGEIAKMPITDGPFDGKHLYNEALRIVADEHYALGSRSPDEIAAWKEEWQNKFSDDELSTEEKADEAIRKMLKSLNTKWDHLYSPLKVKPEAMPKAGDHASRVIARHGVAAAVDLGDGIFMIRLESFDDGSSYDVHQVLSACRGIKGIVLDLIGNPGGNMLEASEILAMFVPQGNICRQRSYMDGRLIEEHNILDDSGLRIERFRVNSDGTLSYHRSLQIARYGVAIPSTVPVAVLVNNDSASASEMVTAALKRFRNATIIGKRTHGKGVFQRVHPISFGRSLAVTSGEYRIDGDRRIHQVGVVPDLDPTPELDGKVGSKDEDLKKYYLTNVRAGKDDCLYQIAEREKWEKAATAAGIDVKKLADNGDWSIGPKQVESEYKRQGPIGSGSRKFATVLLVVLFMTIAGWGFFIRLNKRRLTRTAEQMEDVEGTSDVLRAYFKLRKIDAAKQPQAMRVASQADALDVIAEGVEKGTPASILLEQLVTSIAGGTRKLKEAIAKRACNDAKVVIAQVHAAIASDQSGGEHLAQAIEPLQRAEDIVRIEGIGAQGQAAAYIKALEFALSAKIILLDAARAKA